MSEVPGLARRAAAEALGTFALVFAGCGAIVTNAERAGALGSVGVSLVFGLVILAGVAAFGHLSGAHFNPAVTGSFFLTRHLPGRCRPRVNPIYEKHRKRRETRECPAHDRAASQRSHDLSILLPEAASTYQPAPKLLIP
jgi:hypothetical protein